MRFDCEISCRDNVAGEGDREMKLCIVISRKNLKTSTETRSSNARRKTKRSVAWYEDFVSFLRRGKLVKQIPHGIRLRERCLPEKNIGKKLVGRAMSYVSGSTIIPSRIGKFERIELGGVDKRSMCWSMFFMKVQKFGCNGTQEFEKGNQNS